MPNRENLECPPSHHAAAGSAGDQLTGLCRLQDMLSLVIVAAPLPTKSGLVWFALFSLDNTLYIRFWPPPRLTMPLTVVYEPVESECILE